MLPQQKLRRPKIPERQISLPEDSEISEKMALRLEGLSKNGRLEWKLKKKQVDYIKNTYGYNVYPFLYKVPARKFHYVKNRSGIAKELSDAATKGKTYVISKLSKQDKDFLDALDIKYKPYKYVITTSHKG